MAKQDAFDKEMMILALKEARKCVPKPTGFSVGCVLVAPLEGEQLVLATGYSRELEGNTHAEANALAKTRDLGEDGLRRLLLESRARNRDADSQLEVKALPSIDEVLRTATVYTTMEPCSVRTSGLAPCADALIVVGVRRVVIGTGEPDDFVQCEGTRKLEESGIKVDYLKEMEEECLQVARQGQT
ncbi:diaminohydroxyphosphoribosylamino-pyrimidine deaminase [Pyrrhoderma noxium]|uniref:Diaminohydroxyphosphoribosylamino-pyrimidine deaminase n=1 Tax=Pyrrhoderma noxium TaxID=2282107 RepID=A0A286UVK5_9AGAM|nr:diaminohydroxyphosphoribosylamino-pyrimidine deaminase [Pyrrhoderma noxium]